MADIQIKDYDGNVVADTSAYEIARSIDVDQFTRVFDSFLNIGGKGWSSGFVVGDKLRFTHRTLQRSAIVFCLGIIAGISDQEHSDARNEVALETAKKIKQMLDDGELPFGCYI